MNKNITLTKVITANWSIADTITKPKIDVSKLTREEQADLIIERLTYGVTEDLLEDQISATLSKLIADEIDAEILRTMKGLK